MSQGEPTTGESHLDRDEPGPPRIPWYRRTFVINLLFFGMGALVALVVVDLSFDWMVSVTPPRVVVAAPVVTPRGPVSDDERAAKPISVKGSRGQSDGGRLGRFKDDN